MNALKRGILLGMSIGDGHVFFQRKSGAAGLKVTHCLAQKDYAIHKINLLHSILGGKKPQLFEFDNSGYPGVYFSKGHKYFRLIRKRLYKDNRKVPSRDILEQLTPEGIALWYMDDGTLGLKRRNGKIHARELHLCTMLTKEENQEIIDYFLERHDIRFGQAKDKRFYRLRCGTHETKKFIRLVEPYIIPTMWYKVDLMYPCKAHECPAPAFRLAG